MTPGFPGFDRKRLVLLPPKYKTKSQFRLRINCTFGLINDLYSQDSDRRRSPHLLPYVYVDEAIKIANR